MYVIRHVAADLEPVETRRYVFEGSSIDPGAIRATVRVANGICPEDTLSLALDLLAVPLLVLAFLLPYLPLLLPLQALEIPTVHLLLVQLTFRSPLPDENLMFLHLSFPFAALGAFGGSGDIVQRTGHKAEVLQDGNHQEDESKRIGEPPEDTSSP